MKEGEKCGERSANRKDEKCTHVLGRKFEGKRALGRHWRRWRTILKCILNIIRLYIFDFSGSQQKPAMISSKHDNKTTQFNTIHRMY
jgi:hypothetical protein